MTSLPGRRPRSRSFSVTWRFVARWQPRLRTKRLTATGKQRTSNAQRRTPNLEPREMERAMDTDYDLEERLLEYSARIIRLVERLPNTRAGNHLAGQLLRSGTSPLPNHGETQAAVYGVPALAGQTQIHHGSPSVSSSFQGTAPGRLKPELHTLQPARVCYSAWCSLVPLWNAKGCAFPTSPSAIPKGLCPPAQGCARRATLGEGPAQRLQIGR